MKIPTTGLVDAVRNRVDKCADQAAYRFLDQNCELIEELTLKELDQDTRALAEALSAQDLFQQPVLILAKPGIDFICAFLACLYAGAIAVPMPLPRSSRSAGRFNAIVSNAGLRAIISSTITEREQTLLESVSASGELPRLNISDYRDVQPRGLTLPAIESEHIAFLQYTSGSTGEPKGVTISHGNLAHQLGLLAEHFNLSTNSVMFNWLPAYHDMGLVGGLLSPLFVGFPCYFVQPKDFFHHPLLWFKAISKFGITVTGGPNFSYDWCVEKVDLEECVGLDLSSWKVAFNGAEPIRHTSLQTFSRKFSSLGFDPQAIQTCYGMAESTLMVSGKKQSALPKVLRVNKEKLASGSIELASEGYLELVSSGLVVQTVAIVDPGSKAKLDDRHVGEIWVSGGSVSQGYWRQNGSLLTDGFEHKLDGYPGQRFLNTGDLGFLIDGEIFVTGRASDLIIVKGRNLYPQDLEFTAEGACGCGQNISAAFQMISGQQEKLVLVMESIVYEQAKMEQMASEARQAIGKQHGVSLDSFYFVRSGTLSRTTSGKVRRKATREACLHDKLRVKYHWEKGNNGQRSTLAAKQFVPPQAGLEQTIADQIAQELDLDCVGRFDSFFELGGDSVSALKLTSQLEQLFSIKLNVEELFSGSSLAELSYGVANAIALQTVDLDIQETMALLDNISEEEASKLLETDSE